MSDKPTLSEALTEFWQTAYSPIRESIIIPLAYWLNDVLKRVFHD